MMPTRHRRRRPAGIRQRRAALLAATIACLLVVLLFSSAVVRGLTLRQRHSRVLEQEVQCQYLLEAATLRAQIRLQADADYQGETWRVDGQSGGMKHRGVVEIQVTEDADDSAPLRIEIQAQYPDDPLWRVRKGRQLQLPHPQPGANS